LELQVIQLLLHSIHSGFNSGSIAFGNIMEGHGGKARGKMCLPMKILFRVHSDILPPMYECIKKRDAAKVTKHSIAKHD
jgi:hypothetical protein